jgi:hypothetical protein
VKVPEPVEVSSTKSSRHRYPDDDIMDDHPFDVIYVQNPRTGRDIKKLICMLNDCGKVFEKKWNFKDHIRMHLKQKPYSCDLYQ